MTSPFHPLARGLRLVIAGFLLTCWGLGSALGVYLLVEWTPFPTLSDAGWLMQFVFSGLLLAAVVGLLFGVLGRLRCLKMPDDLPTVRAHLLMATVMEGCGWGSLITGVVVTIVFGLSVLTVVGMIFSSFFVFCGRVAFLLFLRSLARVLKDRPSVRRARLSLDLFLSCCAVGLAGMGVAIIGNSYWQKQLTHPVGFLLLAIAGMSGLAGLILYDRLLGGLARSVNAFAEATAEDDG